ncbi:MAG TPA: hypothetical protein VGQ11_11610, partial [Candidatus Acidoferrales bacterium]|nr:hypothetical protein [Candidatus Acidoferrales bacterium]
MKRSLLVVTGCLAGALLFLLVMPSPPAQAAARATSAAAPQEEDFDDVMDKARLNFNRRNYEDALKFYKRANKMKGENCAECLWGMAQTYSKLGADKNVVETCDRLVPAAADDKALASKAHNLKGITLAAMAMEKIEKPDLKKLADAESEFRLALATG